MEVVDFVYTSAYIAYTIIFPDVMFQDPLTFWT